MTGARFNEERAALSLRPRSANTMVREGIEQGANSPRLTGLVCSTSLNSDHFPWTASTTTTMANSDSEDDVYDDIEFENASDADEDIDEDILDALEGDLTAAVAAEGTEGEEVCLSLLNHSTALKGVLGHRYIYV